MIKIIFISALTIGILGFFSYKITYALFSDTATSQTNTFAAAQAFPTATPTPTPPIAQTLVMNEILPLSSCNSGQTNGQFVELWNGSGSTVNLKDFKLTDGTNTIAIANSNTDLLSGAFAILVKATGVINQCLGGNVNGAVTVNLGGNVDLNTGLLKLIDTDGTTVLDKVEFGASNGGILQTIPDQSVERNLLGLDTALGDTFAISDFGKQCPVTPGDWSIPTGNCPVVINELMWPGSSKSTADEWIELRNTTGSSINLAGWIVRGASTGGGDLTISSGTLLTNGFFLIANYASTDANSVLNVIPDLVTTSVSLANSDAKYTLLNSLGHIVDTADDGSGAPLAGSNLTPKKAMERNTTPGNGALVGSWHTATTTVNLDPGATELATPKSANSL